MKFNRYIAIIFWFNISNLSSQVFENADLKISMLEDKIWVIETFDNTTMYLVEGSKKSLLIDTGTKCDSLDKIIQRITPKPLVVVLTHGHGDHSGNIKYFDSIYMHPADTIFVDTSFHGKINFLKDGDVFDLGDKSIEVKYMPAHTPGSIVLVDRQAKSCFTGDAFGSGLVWLQLRPYSSMKTYLNSCFRMKKLIDNGIEKLYCGHYPYPKKAFHKDYIEKMIELATLIDNGKVQDSKPYSIKVSISCNNPMLVGSNDNGIVYDPEHIK